MVGKVLVITADPRDAQQLTRVCDELGVGIHVVVDCQAALSYLQSGSAELIIGAYEAIRQMQQFRPGLHTVVLSSGSDSRQMIAAIRHGVLDYLARPLQHADAVRRVGEALRLAEEAAQPALERPRKVGQPGAGGVGVRLVGQSPAMQEVYRQIGRIAPQEINVLVTGESGTGKELVAQAIHDHSPRADQPMMAINCAAIPEPLLESELFGHEKGAFTGADRRRIGKFEQCHGGTLFLDEIGDMPPATQAKLLRVLQDQRIQRVGGSETILCDVRILAATHQPLEQMILEKRFRQDLYYRLKVATIHLPPLREREVDAVLLAHYFLDRIGRQMSSQIRSFSPEAVAALLAYPWPGNVRELENVIRSSLAMARGTVFRSEFLPTHMRRNVSGEDYVGRRAEDFSRPLASAAEGPAEEPHADTLAWVVHLLDQFSGEGAASEPLFSRVVGQAERALIHQVLVRTEGRLCQAAEQMGISRTTLRKKMRVHGIVVKAGPEQGGRGR